MDDEPSVLQTACVGVVGLPSINSVRLAGYPGVYAPGQASREAAVKQLPIYTCKIRGRNVFDSKSMWPQRRLTHDMWNHLEFAMKWVWWV